MPEQMTFSMVPFLFILEIALLVVAARRSYRLGAVTAGQRNSLYFMTAMLAVWGGLCIYLATTGMFLSRQFLAAYPTFWLPFLPVVFVMIILMMSCKSRDAVRGLIDATPIAWLVGVHALRILAIGGLIKAWRLEFNPSFAIYVGGPDLLFGLSALLMLWLARRDRIGERGLLVWSLFGVLAILPGAPLVAQWQLPGALYSYTETPSIETLYEFPMVLAPALVVPVFVLMNMLVAIRMIERRWASLGRSAQQAA